MGCESLSAVEQALDLGAAQQFSGMLADQFAQVGGDHGDRVHHRVAGGDGLLFERGRDPDRRHAEGRLPRLFAGKRPAAGLSRDGQQVRALGLPAAHLDAAQRDHILSRLEAQVVGDVHGRNQEAHLGREVAAQGAHPASSCPPCFSSTSGISWKPISRVRSSRRSSEASSELCAPSGFFFSAGASSVAAAGALRREPPAAHKQPSGHGQKGELGQSRNQAHAGRDHARHVERCGPAQQLLPDLAAQHAGRVGARERDAAGHRDQQRRNDRHQAVAHREHGVGARGLAQLDALLQGADQQAGDDVDGRDQNRGQRVALVEARRAVHGAVELGLAGDGLAAAPRLGLVDQPRVHVGVDGHLFAGQSIEREARRDLGGAHGAVRDHQELNRDQSQKQHEADHIVAAHHELPEGLDHLARRGRSLLAVQQNAPAGGDVEREAEEREQQEQRGKDRELDGAANLHGGEEDDDRGRHRERQQKVQARGRQRHQHDKDHADGRHGQQVVAQPVPDRGPGRKRSGRQGCW